MTQTTVTESQDMCNISIEFLIIIILIISIIITSIIVVIISHNSIYGKTSTAQ